MNGTGVVVIGDSLLDRDVVGSVERLAPDAPVPVVDECSSVTRPGGAALAAALLAGDGPTTLVTALGDDPAGREVARLLSEAGVELVDLGSGGPTPEKIRIGATGRPLVRLDRGGSGGSPVVGDVAAADAALQSASAVLVSDYGRGMTALPPLRRLLEDTAVSTPVVWDPHPRGAAPVPRCRMVTPNRSEASRWTPGIAGDDLAAVERRARRLLETWSAHGVVVTLGQGGALYDDGGPHPLVVPAPPVNASDPCGAGDRFSGSLAFRLAEGDVPSQALVASVFEAARFVEAGGAAGLGVSPFPTGNPNPGGDAVRLAARVRAGGGTVVATGGCFDLLHAGHVAMLEAARRLGDCLIVCLNSDRSVRALKGAGRPVTGCEDRRAVLTALASVDAVEVFDDDVPTDALRRIRPHVWAKGGDYGAGELPEARALEEWGGRVAILPYLGGRSTSGILQQVAT